MEVTATHKHARMTPRKIRPLASALRGVSAVVADQQLAFTAGKAAGIIRKVLASAVANASQNHSMKKDTLTVVRVEVNEGLKMRRYMPASKGQAHPFTRRTSHVTVVVAGQAPKKKATKKSEIETVSADVYAAEAGKHEEHEETVVDTTKPPKDAPKGTVKPDKETGEAFQKTKSMQQGGDKTKTHRRKSM